MALRSDRSQLPSAAAINIKTLHYFRSDERYLKQIWKVDAGHHSTSFFCMRISTSGKIQDGGGRYLLFVFMKAMAPKWYSMSSRSMPNQSMM